VAYINCGAYVNGIRPKTKKALREALKADPTAVEFDSTTAIGPHVGGRFTAQHTVASSDTLQVCGPDPYRSRVWYASIKNGKLS
jgi:hypothetical protein